MASYLIRRADYTHFQDGDQLILPAISSGIVETDDLMEQVKEFLSQFVEVGTLELKIALMNKPPIKIEISRTYQPATEHHPLEADGVRPMGYVPSKGTHVA